MAHHVIEQPNGKYCIFSTIVDGFIGVEMTRNDVKNYYISEAVKKEEVRVNDMFERKDKGIIMGYQMSFDHAVQINNAVHGED